MKARLIVLVIAAVAALGYLAFMFGKGDSQARSDRPASSAESDSTAPSASPADDASSAASDQPDRSAGSERFVTEEAFEKNLQSQVAMTPQTLAQLRSFGLTDKSRVKLEFFFFTNSKQKAAALAKVLQKRGYKVEYGPSEADKKQLLVTGSTDKMALDDATVVAWTRDMCQLGFESDCQFNGWGTTPGPE